ncbi:MAG: tyrosine--tRNA ligase [Bacteroidetes bacterium SB0662_bin_6]|nr:tyrosine--tRNA ligase [Bacteroidetes bacterium SB0668_bin_1]MYE04986.1 tyrosine--tRNA ligase [Bacteroidetes bacterium SB0662_bin_6]
MKFPPIDKQLALIERGVAEIIPQDALIEKLRKAEKTGEPLIVKLGCDPSRPDLHLGHSVVLRKLRQFQDLGHQAVLIVGDFTGMIGDPSGRSQERPALTVEETRENGRSYFEQASRILDPERTRIVYNSEWLENLSFSDVIQLAGKYTVARMLERDDFEKRYRSGEPIGIHEFLYPLAQAQDSVAIRADIELGGTDQKFNLLVGRAVQQSEKMEPQVCIMMPILPGTDGVEKMSKSLDNYIGISEPPEEIYGKTLSIPDDLIYPWFELATNVPTEELPAIEAAAKREPRNTKHRLAWTIASMYHGDDAADKARSHFEKTVIKGGIPENMESVRFAADEGPRMGILDLMTRTGLTSSNGEARRLIAQHAVSIDGEKISDVRLEVDVHAGPSFVIKAGKRRFVRILREEEDAS